MKTLLDASRHPLAHRFERGLQSARVGVGERMLLLVSGGADSMAMMALAAAVLRRDDAALASLSVRSYDHGLRPEAADECALVVDAARSLGIADAQGVRLELARGGNILERAREARLAATAREANLTGSRVALVAHHADDRAESLLLGLSRGLGFEALTALLPAREGLAGDCALVRPLLGARRAELRAFVEALGIGFVDDPSNERRSRGAMRSDPSLAALVDRIAAGSHALFEEAAQLSLWRADEVARRLPPQATRVARAAIDEAPEALRAAMIRALVHRAGSDIARATLDAALAGLADGDRAPRSFDCEGGVRLVVDAREVSCCVRR